MTDRVQLSLVEQDWLGVDVTTPDGDGQVVAEAPRDRVGVAQVWVTDGNRCWAVPLDRLHTHREEPLF